MGPLSIGPAGYFHLKDAEVDPELQFFVAVQADNLTHFDRARFMGPILQERIEIKTHYVINVRNTLSLCQWQVMNEAAGLGAAAAAIF